MIFLGVLILLYFGGLFLVARFSVRPIRTPLFLSPGLMGTAQENIEFEGRDHLLLKGWWLPNPTSKVVVVFAHGYLMNSSEPAAVAANLWQDGYAALLFDFPGHGRSPSANVTFGIREREDVRAAVEYARSRMPEAKIVVWGSSMGAAATSLAAREIPVDAMILDSVFTDLRTASDGWWEFLGGNYLRMLLSPAKVFSKLIAGVDLDSANITEALKQTSCPVLMPHGDADVLVPISEAHKNAAARDGIRLDIYPGCNHSEGRWIFPAEYYMNLGSFLRENDLLP
ncbi:MAG: lysophospholipase [Armatimonadetes bacterium]|nr:lysophospholipase [Armatimonadota bacterium]